MASTPSSLWMNTTDGSPAVTGTPRPLNIRGYSSPTKLTYDQTGGLTLNLKKVLGSTVSSVSGFDCLPDRSCFATCAGSTAVIHHVDQELNVTQRYFRSRPNTAVQGLGDVTQPNTPDWRGRQNSSIWSSNFGARGPASPAAEFTNSPSKGSARQRTRAATCLSLSPDGKLLAVGETGYAPRILLFSTSSNTTDSPYATLSEHTFGVRCLAFSPDSRFICSVGDIHDGFVHLWALNPRTGMPRLYASNKCTSFVQDLAWLGTSFVTVGTRHIKLWRTDSLGPPSPSKAKFRSDILDSVPSSPSGAKTLPGRNCLLGSSLESTFVCVAAISDSKAVVGSDRGDVCLLDDTGDSPLFVRACKLGFPIKCVSVDLLRDCIWIGGQDDEIRKLAISELKTPPSTPSAEDKIRSPSIASGLGPSNRSSAALALGAIGNRLVSVDSEHCICMFDSSASSVVISHSASMKSLRSHSSPVLGITVSHTKDGANSRLVTWDATAKLIFWDFEGQYQGCTSIALDQLSPEEDPEINELKILRSPRPGDFCVAGDKYGVLRLLKGDGWSVEQVALKAHSGEINDIALVAVPENQTLISTAGRDRTIQVYQTAADETTLMQTIEQHASSVNTLLFLSNGQTLLSASSDRTVVVHTLATSSDMKAFLPTRVLTTKQSPVSMALWPNDEMRLAVTTMDKQLHKFDLDSGHCMNSTRLLDETNNAVIMSSLTTRTVEGSPGVLHILLGVSSTDKSIRIHDLSSGSGLVREYGHSEGLTNVEILEESTIDGCLTMKIASTGLDGTVMLWELTNSLSRNDPSTPVSPVIDTPSSQQPLRRVLSKNAIAEFSKNLEANGMSPLPSTASRNPSPTRSIRRKVSKYSLTGSMSGKISTPPVLRRPNRSPSPPSPATTLSAPRRPMLRVKSVGNFNDMAYAADQLMKSMRTFRKKMNASSETVTSETLKELEKELSMTAKMIGQNARRRQSASEMNVGDVLDEYSDKLAQMVEEKVNIGFSQAKRKDSATSSENTNPRGTG